MAVVTGTVAQPFGFQTPAGPSLNHTISSVEYETFCAFVPVTWVSGTYASGDNANFNPAAMLETTRDGKTVTVLQACCVQAGQENGAIIGADACTVSANVVTCQLLQENLSTERADGSMSATWERPVVFAVWYRTAVE